MEIKNLGYGLLFLVWVSIAGFFLYGTKKIEEFNDAVSSEIAAFRSQSENHELVMSTLHYCHDHKIDYQGCKVEVHKRAKVLLGETKIEATLSQLESWDADLREKRKQLFVESKSARLASVFYGVKFQGVM